MEKDRWRLGKQIPLFGKTSSIAHIHTRKKLESIHRPMYYNIRVTSLQMVMINSITHVEMRIGDLPYWQNKCTHFLR